MPAIVLVTVGVLALAYIKPQEQGCCQQMQPCRDTHGATAQPGTHGHLNVVTVVV